MSRKYDMLPLLSRKLHVQHMNISISVFFYVNTVG